MSDERTTMNSPISAGKSSADSGNPNVLMIVCDDLNDYVGAMGGHPQAKTPHIDRLAEQGLLFANAHSNAFVTYSHVPCTHAHSQLHAPLPGADSQWRL